MNNNLTVSNIEHSINDASEANQKLFELELNENNPSPVNIETLKQFIHCGQISKENNIRLVGEQNQWTKLEQFTLEVPTLYAMYHPIWTFTVQGFQYGLVIGIILKILDLMIGIGLANEKMLIPFIFIASSIVLSKWISIAPIIVGVLLAREGYGLTPWMMMAGASVVGMVFGGAVGALIGTLIGYIKRSKQLTAADAIDESDKIRLWGILLPSISIIVFGFLYFCYLIPYVLVQI